MQVFVLGDKLLLTSEVVIQIVSYAPLGPPNGPRQTQRRKEAFYNFTTSLIKLWTFGIENVAERRTIKSRIEKEIKTYQNF